MAASLEQSKRRERALEEEGRRLAEERADALHSQLLQAAKERAGRLQEALARREELERAQEALGEWLEAAGERLAAEEGGLDYKGGPDQLQKHKVGSGNFLQLSMPRSLEGQWGTRWLECPHPQLF